MNNPIPNEKEEVMDWRDWKGCTLSVSGEPVEAGTPHLIIESGEPPPTVPVEVVPKSSREAAEAELERQREALRRIAEDGASGRYPPDAACMQRMARAALSPREDA